MQAKFTFYLLPFLLIFFAPCFITGQSLFEDLGGAKTDFTVLTDNKDMEVVAQGVYSSIIPIEQLDGGASKEVYWFQFIAHASISEIPFFGRSRKKNYDIQLIDAAGNELMKLTYKMNGIYILWSNKMYVYSMKLEGVPIILLDKVKTINIVKYTKT